MSIAAGNCMNWILDQVPAFRPFWESHLEWWGDDEPGLGNNVAAFSHYIVHLMRNDQFEALKTTMDIVERLLTEGDDDVRTVIATNCLENIINRASSGGLTLESFVQTLGQKSRAYCIEWDRFTGAQTPGLQSSKLQ